MLLFYVEDLTFDTFLATLLIKSLIQLKALGFLQAFEESTDWTPLLSFCDDSNLHISVFK